MSKHHGIEQEEMAPYELNGPEDIKASMELIESIIEDQQLQIEALKIRIDDLRGFRLTDRY